jgi:hypothetical protein
MATTRDAHRTLARRIDDLERSNRRLKLLLAGLGVAMLSCGAATTTAQYKKVSVHELVLFGAEEKGHAATLTRYGDGGLFRIFDSAGQERIRIDPSGIYVLDETGKIRHEIAPSPPSLSK